ncbi:MAG: hypothetical protein DI582_08260 [Azospirillum brasilense]|nr:MAG: hypothetical protein DI582_08260 [Azospirillum brasilense]
MARFMKKLALCMLAGMCASPAFAVDKIYMPYVDAGEWELEYFANRSVDDDGALNNAQAHEISLEHGVNDWWQTEVYGIWQKDPGNNLSFDAVEWENIFELTKPGEYWADMGATIAYEWTPDSDQADALEARLLFAKPIGNTINVLNLAIEKEVGAGTQDDLEAALLWSTRYNYSPYFQPGFEIQSEFGEVNDPSSFEDQEHYVGPVFYGTIPFEDEGDEIEGLEYRVGYLFGASSEASDGQVVLQLEYELDF